MGSDTLYGRMGGEVWGYNNNNNKKKRKESFPEGNRKREPLPSTVNYSFHNARRQLAKDGGGGVSGGYPGLEGGQSQAHADGGLVGVDHRVVVDVAVVAHSDWLVVVLVDAVECVDWL